MFTIDHYALWIMLGGVFIASYLILHSKPTQPSFLFSEVKSLNLPEKNHWYNLPSKFNGLAILCFVLAFLDPHIRIPEKISKAYQAAPKEGIALYLVLDQSGSMSEELVAKDAKGNRRTVKKMDLLKQVTKEFISKQKTNLIGIVAFARIPHVLSPLTLDQKTLLEQVEKLDSVTKNEADGTSMGYAIYKTAHFIASARYFAEKEPAHPGYVIKNSVLVVVTDGLQNPNLLDKGNRLRTIELDEAAEFAKNQGIRLYIINIDPLIGMEEYAPHRRQLERITRKTGGDFFMVTSQKGLEGLYDKIDQLEKEKLSLPATGETAMHYVRLSFYPFFIALGLLFLFLFIFLDSTILRKVP